MLSVITCTNCRASGALPIKFSVIYDVTSCACCNNLDTKKWDYHFCNTECHIDWISVNNIHKEGFVCRSCMNITGRSTGFAFGFERNGVCNVCKGSKRLKI